MQAGQAGTVVNGGAVRGADGVGPGNFNRGNGNVYGGVGNTNALGYGNGRPWPGTRSGWKGYDPGYAGSYGGYGGYSGLYGASGSANVYSSSGDSSSTYSYYSNPYSTGGTSTSYPSGSYTGDSSQSSTSSSSSPSTAQTAAPTANSASVTVNVPADAQVWIDDQMTGLTGTVRQFYSPPLTPGQTFTYEVRARWMQDGTPVERVRQVPVHAGAQVTVDFVGSN